MALTHIKIQQAKPKEKTYKLSDQQGKWQQMQRFVATCGYKSLPERLAAFSMSG